MAAAWPNALVDCVCLTRISIWCRPQASVTSVIRAGALNVKHKYILFDIIIQCAMLTQCIRTHTTHNYTTKRDEIQTISITEWCALSATHACVEERRERESRRQLIGQLRSGENTQTKITRETYSFTPMEYSAVHFECDAASHSWLPAHTQTFARTQILSISIKKICTCGDISSLCNADGFSVSLDTNRMNRHYYRTISAHRWFPMSVASRHTTK